MVCRHFFSISCYKISRKPKLKRLSPWYIISVPDQQGLRGDGCPLPQRLPPRHLEHHGRGAEPGSDRTARANVRRQQDRHPRRIQGEPRQRAYFILQ